MNDSASALRSMSATNQEAKQALLVVYEHTLQKRCPGDAAVATACLEPKWAATMSCLDAVEATRQKPLVVELAGFIGEVRVVPSRHRVCWPAPPPDSFGPDPPPKGQLRVPVWSAGAPTTAREARALPGCHE